MKNRFNTYDLICTVVELQRLIGMRVNQVYDVDSKTYLIRLQQGENKVLLLIESGTRMHTTSFEWPKNMAPSGFSMKMRKHIRNKRLEKLTQLGLDRIVDLQFGSGDAAYHVIVELYDRGNIIFTDHEHVILNIFRPHTEGDDVKFMVREKYPSNRGKERPAPLTEQNLREIFANAKQDDSLKKILNPHLIYGPAIIEHMLLKVGLSPSCKLKNLNIDENITKFIEAFQIAEAIIDEAFTPNHKGYIIQKREKKAKDGDEFLSNQEFHPMIFEQNRNAPYLEFDSFDKAVDEFFSNMESQKIDMKGVQQEMAALKKLENVKKDHEKRISQLTKLQIEDTQKAELITRNQELVDDAILAIRQAIANQMPWSDIENLVKEATKCGDSVASVIKALKLNINHITLLLNDPYEEYDETGQVLFKPTLVDVDLDLSAHANAKKYYEKRRQAATKQKKTIESQDKAFKSAEKKTKLTLKEVKTSVTISKARKVYWWWQGFETALDLVNDSKSFWAGATLNMAAVYGGILDNVIGGRDQQQNELIVKRYLKKNDIYVHAGIVGASSIVIKNPKSDPVPVKTLNEAGTMAMCYSTAWEAKVVTSAWWVYAHQVSKTAPTGEYLTTGSFMIRGKKNFLPQCHLIMGFTFMFKLEDSSLERHLNERKKKEIEESIPEENDDELQAIEELELEGESSDDNEPETTKGNVKSESDSKETSEPAYPDTEVLVVHKNVEKQCSIEVKIPSEKNTKKEEPSVEEIDDDYVVYLGDDKPVIIKPPEVKKSDKQVTYNKQTTDKDDKKENSKPEQKQQSKQKRGQKSKLKKIKEKYKDQDEEEREIRMRILQGSPNKKEDKKRKKGKNTHVPVALKREPQPKKPPPPVQLLSVDESVQKPVVVEHEEEDDEEKETNEFTAAADIDMLDSLTGQPLPEDELLFAVPVVAPYNAIISYKYKVKLTPGTGKRGKTAKTALNVFLKDRTATTREKDLLKFVKDQDLARNFPGKVKLSAPQLMKYK